jgi:hypothetical protein
MKGEDYRATDFPLVPVHDLSQERNTVVTMAMILMQMRRDGIFEMPDLID